GPPSTSRDHFHPPNAVTTHLGKRWEFKCRHCKASYTFKRTVNSTLSFEAELKQPALGNLSTHVRLEHAQLEIPDSEPGMTRGVSAASAKIMEGFLREGKLNPAVNPTQKGFNKVFAAWIIEDDHPFTTGETGGIARLFRYMQSRFTLPSDTTVRNTLAKIYAEMFENLKTELAAIDKWVIDREELRPLLLTSKEWELLEKLGDILQIFTQVTLQMSRAQTPTLPWVLPMYEHMLKNLKAHRDDHSLLESLRTAASAGLEKLETYYQKAKGCQFNVVATSESPNNAKVLFEFVFESYKKTHATLPAQTKKTPLAKTSSSFLDDVSMLDVEEDDSAPQESEFERFYVACRTRGRGEPNNPLAWWKVCALLTGEVFIH
ncbi:hypothetical protein C8R43DRAFT_887357, partial [Mycena crocata]